MQTLLNSIYNFTGHITELNSTTKTNVGLLYLNQLYRSMKLTNLGFNRLDQVNVVLCHQCDRHAVPTCRRKISSCLSCIYLMIKSRVFTEIFFNVTCSCCSSHSVDVGFGKPGCVVVDDNLDRWNIQTSKSRKERTDA